VFLRQLNKQGILNPKFKGLRDATLMGLRVPASLLIESWPDNYCVCYELATEIFARLQSEGSSHEGLCLRFGDKYGAPNLPPSVCYLGSGDPRLQAEYALQVRSFADAIGIDRAILSGETAQACLAELLQTAGRHLQGQERCGAQCVVQRAIDTITTPLSGYGVAYTRDHRSGEDRDVGRYMWNVSGFAFNHIHVGSSRKRWLPDLLDEAPDAYAQLLCSMKLIEAYYRDIRFLEFAISRGELWIVQITQRREQVHNCSVHSRKLPEEWMHPRLPIEAWTSEIAQSMVRTYTDHGLSLEIFSESTLATEMFARFVRNHRVGEETSTRWRIFLRKTTIPGPDYSAGSPVEIFRTRSMVLLGRRYLKDGAELTYVPLRSAVIVIDRTNQISVVAGRLTPLVMLYAARCLVTALNCSEGFFLDISRGAE
jgi:hypothetical protein